MHNEAPSAATVPAPEKIIDRVRKLLALAERAGTPEEAGTAFATAQAMIAKHALSMEQIRQAQLRADSTRPDEPIVKGIGWVFMTGSTQVWIGMLANVIGSVNGCDSIYGRAHGAAARDMGGKRDEIKYIEFWGRASDLELVKELLAIVVGQIDGMARRSGFEGRTALNNFRLGATQVVCERLRQAAGEARKAIAAAAREQDATAPASAREVTALALTTLDNRLPSAASALRAAYPKLRKGSSSSSRVDYAARSAGQSAGRSVNLSRSKALR